MQRGAMLCNAAGLFCGIAGTVLTTYLDNRHLAQTFHLGRDSVPLHCQRQCLAVVGGALGAQGARSAGGAHRVPVHEHQDEELLLGRR